MSARGLLGETFSVLRSNALLLSAVAVILLVPAEVAFAYLGDPGTTQRLVAAVLLYGIVYPWFGAAVYATLERPVWAVAAPYGAIADRVPALVLLSFLVLVPLAVAYVLLVVPGLVLSARWSAAGPLLVLERHGPIEALGVSNQLVRGSTWKVIAAGALVVLVAVVLAFPGIVLTELASQEWLDGLGEAAIDLGLFTPVLVFTHAVYRRARAVSHNGEPHVRYAIDR